MREVLPSYDQSLLTLKRCVHGFGGAASARVVEWPVSFFLCLNSEAARSHGSLNVCPPGGNPLLRLCSCPSYLTHCFGDGGGGREEREEGGWADVGLEPRLEEMLVMGGQGAEDSGPGLLYLFL